MFDKYKKRYQAPKASERVRHQIAVEAARRLCEAARTEQTQTGDGSVEIREADFYTAKRQAAAVLGHRVRPGDLPSDGEVREQMALLTSDWFDWKFAPSSAPEPEDDGPPAQMADHVDRFAIYRMRLQPLESVKQNAHHHPEGDALYHSLQVFEHARAARPYDEEFLLAALLHDVGKAIDPSDHVGTGVEALRGAVTERTLWLIEHHMEILNYREKGISPRARKAIEGSEYLEDLKLLRDLDDAGRVPGAPVGTVEEALEYIKGLEDEAYLDEHA
ncbi:MAG: HD domain-containing protein [Isosphaeraceae bacterium]